MSPVANTHRFLVVVVNMRANRAFVCTSTKSHPIERSMSGCIFASEYNNYGGITLHYTPN